MFQEYIKYPLIIYQRGDDIIFTVLAAFCDDQTLSVIEEIIKGFPVDIPFYTAKTLSSAMEIFTNCNIHFFIVSLDKKSCDSLQFVHELQKIKKYRTTPTILLSSNLEYLIPAFTHFKFCNYILLPFDKDTCNAFTEYLNMYFSLYQKLGQQFRVGLDMVHSYRNIPLHKIFFVEAVQHKCIIHTAEDKITISMPLYKLKQTAPLDFLKQTHRSYLVNIDNISKIDKTRDPWTISFQGYPNNALISRTYKKDVLEYLEMRMRL